MATKKKTTRKKVGRSSRVAKSKANTPRKACPYCGKFNHPRKSICDHCGKDTRTSPARSNGRASARAKRRAEAKDRSAKITQVVNVVKMMDKNVFAGDVVFASSLLRRVGDQEAAMTLFRDALDAAENLEDALG